MPRTRDEFKVAVIPIAEIKPEVVPLSQEKLLKRALFSDEGEQQHQVREIRVVPIEDAKYKYRYKDGRRRGETVRSENPDAKVRVIIEDYEDEKTMHLHALIGNAGTPNYPGESKHCAYLRDEEGMTDKEIAELTGIKIHTIWERLRVYDNLISELFELFNDGTITFSAALSLTKLSGKEQRYLYDKYKAGEFKLSNKNILAHKREIENKDINNLFDVFANEEPDTESDKGQTFVVGVMLTPKQMDDIMSNKSVMVEYNGKEIELCRCEW